MPITNRIRKSAETNPTQPASGESVGIVVDAAGNLVYGTDSGNVQVFGAATDAVGSFGAVVVKKIPIAATPTGSEQDTTFDLPAKAVLVNAFVDVTTAEVTGTTKTLDVGLLSSESGGDADGFIDGISVASAGIKIPSLVSGAVTLGVLLKETVTDSNTDTLSARKPFASTAVTAKSVTFTAGDTDFAEFRGDIYLVYSLVG